MFEFENQTKRDMDAEGISLNFMAALSNISATKLSMAFRNTKKLSWDDVRTLQTVLRELKLLIEEVAPVPIRFSNPVVIQELLEARRGGRLFFALVGATGADAGADAGLSALSGEAHE